MSLLLVSDLKSRNKYNKRQQNKDTESKTMEVSIDFEQVFANRIAYTGNTGFTARSNIYDGTFLRDS